MPRIVTYFDYRSPFAYVAAEVLPGFAARHGLELIWRPTDIMQLSNYANGLPYSDVKRRYTTVDAIRTADFHGVKIRVPKPHPVLAERALSLAIIAGDDPRFTTLHTALFRAAWRDQLDISLTDVLRRCIDAADGPADEWLEAAAQVETERALADVAKEAEDAGVFGVPSMCLGDEQFWGLDSLPMIAWRLDQRRA